MTRMTVHRLLSALFALILLGPASLLAQEDESVAPPTPEPVLAQEPQTPEELFEAMLLMVRLDRSDLAKLYLQQFLAGEPDDALLQSLRDQHGTSTFLRLSRIIDLQPESQDLMRRLQALAARTLSDLAYFDGLINQLDGPPRDREAAITALKQFGADAVPGLLDRLGSGDRLDQHDLLMVVLTRLGQPAVAPLLGAIESPSERTRSLAIEALGWLGSEEIVPHLWYPAFGSDQSPLVQQAARQAIARIRYGSPERTDRVIFDGVVAEVRQRALRHFAGEHNWPVPADGQLVVWSWDPQANNLIKTPTNGSRASAFVAQRLSREVMLLSPDSQAGRALFLAASLAEAGHRAGWDQPRPIGPGTAHNLAVFSGAELTEQALHLAVVHHNAASAVGALEALGQIATPATLLDRDGRDSAVIAALDYPHDRVQFAAARCILQTGPKDSFTKGYRVVEVLARALSDGGRGETVIIDPNPQRGTSVAAVLGALGYETSVAVTGREGFRTAAEQGDVMLAVIHPNTIRWELTQTVANFRTDSRTAGIPIAIYGPLTIQRDVERLLNRTSDSTFIVAGGGSADWQRQLVSLVNAVDVPPLTPQQRSERVRESAYWLRHIAESHCTDLYDLSRAEDALSGAVEIPGVAADALIALAAVSRPSAQRRLAEITSAPGLSAEVREMAAWQLANHIQHFGRLLSQADVDELEVAWRNSDDARVRTAMTSVLGSLQLTLEAVGAALKSHRLSGTPK